MPSTESIPHDIFCHGRSQFIIQSNITIYITIYKVTFTEEYLAAISQIPHCFNSTFLSNCYCFVLYITVFEGFIDVSLKVIRQICLIVVFEVAQDDEIYNRRKRYNKRKTDYNNPQNWEIVAGSTRRDIDVIYQHVLNQYI